MIQEPQRAIARQAFRYVFVLVLLCVVIGPNALHAENGAEAWLRYARLDERTSEKYASLPPAVFLAGQSPVLKNAQAEFTRGVRGMLGRNLRIVSRDSGERIIIIGTIRQVRGLDPAFARGLRLRSDGFSLAWTRVRGVECLVVAGATDRGALYGIFALLSRIAQGRAIVDLHEVQQPTAPMRWVNQWDNLDGTIERGYGGASIFYDNGAVRPDLTRAGEYARLLASIGVNGCVVNNVNADPRLLKPDYLRELARIADAFRPWGVQLGLAVDLSAPKVVGGLDTFDPLDTRVAQWWAAKFNEVYSIIPDFGGVVVKADSEGRLGPSAYGRTHADAANVIARALNPHGGFVFYRAFVYDHHLDWTNLKNDRAKAAYDNFHPLDGRFDENVIIQIKNGPIDFQVREPASPLFGGLERTNQAIELQVTQEYTGQQHHTVFLAPMWKEVLDFDMRVNGRRTTVQQIVAGRSFRRAAGGYVGVVNVGTDANWLGNHLALANLYGFGRLAWNPDLSSSSIIDEWARLTFGNDPAVVKTVAEIQSASWPAYESYTGPLGLQTLTNITGSHYGPAPASQERNGWGQWIRAERDGVGMDRSAARGTGFVGQYSPEVRKLYETAAATPDELLLFFHHVPYIHKLHSGKTVVQTIYDAHYDGAERAAHLLQEWETLRGRIDEERYGDVQQQLTYQAAHAIVWRDAIDDWFHRISGIADEKGRVGKHPGRIEAEAMQLDGYAPLAVTPWEGASGGKAVECAEPDPSCRARVRFNGPAGCYTIHVQYFDQSNGISSFRVFADEKAIYRWAADMRLPATAPNADSSTRRRIAGVRLRPGSEIRIEGIPDAGERAALDYIEIHPDAKCTPASSSASNPRIAITFDDLPAHGSLPPGENRIQVASAIIEALRAAHVPPTYGFFNGALLEQQPADVAVIEAWRAAGNLLGNHTFSHMNLNQHSLEEFQADLVRNEPLLEKFMGDGTWRWLRFPYLVEGDTPEKRAGIRSILRQHGYKIAGTTMSFADYLYNEPYARCAAKVDARAIGLLEDTFLAAADESISYYRSLSHTLYGRDIPYVLLMHLGAFDAKRLPRLLELYRSRGFEFVTLDEATRDEFYQQDTDLHLLPGPDNLEGAMRQRHLPLPPHVMPAPQFDSLCR